MTLPSAAYSVVIAVQTIHNLAHDQQRGVFEWVRSIVDPSGVFILADRLAVPTAGLFPFYQALWHRLEQIHGDPITHQESYELERRYLSQKGDRPATLQQHLAWLEAADFEVAAVHVHADRGLLAARPARGPAGS